MSLLWIEKYRPKNLSQIKSQDHIINSIQKFLVNKNLPHLLLFGPSGSGKSSLVHVACKKLYGKSYKYMIMELNASDNRGIDTVRKLIYEFANTKSMINNGIKTVILDEADSMTIMAQNALRKIVENNSANVRFCIICNYINNIIPALKSRCIQFRFSPLKKDDKMGILKKILKKEKFILDEETLEVIIKIANGDMRRSINMLQSLSVVFKNDKKIKTDTIYNYFNIISSNEVENIFSIINSDKSIEDKINRLENLIIHEKDYNLNELLKIMIDRILNKPYTNKQLIFLFRKLAEIEVTLLYDYIPEIVICSIVSVFLKVQNIE